MKFITMTFVTVVASLSGSANAIEINKKSCLDAIESLGLPTVPYDFKGGWFGDKHIFAGTVECSDKRGQMFITQRGTTIVEDGFFGSDVLSARDKALAIQKEKNDALEDERDKLIASARDSYRTSRDTLENETQQQLQEIRDGGMPEAIVAAIDAERVAREQAAKELRTEEAERRAVQQAEEQERDRQAALHAERMAERATELRKEREAEEQARTRPGESIAEMHDRERKEKEQIEERRRAEERRIESEAQEAQREADRVEKQIEERRRAEERRIKSEAQEAQREADRVEEAACRQDLSCWGEKAFSVATVMCPSRIERLAKNDHEWTDGFLGMKFASYRWRDRDTGVVTVLGDSLKFQNGFGAMVNIVYECDVDPASNVVIDIRISEGRL